MALVEELPFTYLHVFPFSPRDGTVADGLNRDMPVPQRVAGERSRELRERVLVKGDGYRRARAGRDAVVVLEDGGQALTGDYLRVRVPSVPGPVRDPGRLHRGVLRYDGEDLYIDLPAPSPSSLPIS